jgi:hypothetical protein
MAKDVAAAIYTRFSSDNVVVNRLPAGYATLSS